ncbi:MAG: ribonuclease P protein component [Flavobacteriaceae bacterium]|nr:ribonuclease P protein component [Flavobacteriaceae bacterium]
MRQTFRKKERLKNSRDIELLFDKGKSMTAYPLRMVYLKNELDTEYPVKVAFSVSKRKMRKAVDRNRLKRQMREAFRKNKHILYEGLKKKYFLMVTFIDENHYKYVEIEDKMIRLFTRLIDQSNNEQNEIHEKD